MNVNGSSSELASASASASASNSSTGTGVPVTVPGNHNQHLNLNQNHGINTNSPTRLTSLSPLTMTLMGNDTPGCTCKKSKCLKLYCQCFAASALCDKQKCKCESCKNEIVVGGEAAAEKDIKRARSNVLYRNPRAFEGKFSSSTSDHAKAALVNANAAAGNGGNSNGGNGGGGVLGALGIHNGNDSGNGNVNVNGNGNRHCAQPYSQMTNGYINPSTNGEYYLYILYVYVYEYEYDYMFHRMYHSCTTTLLFQIIAHDYIHLTILQLHYIHFSRTPISKSIHLPATICHAWTRTRKRERERCP